MGAGRIGEGNVPPAQTEDLPTPEAGRDDREKDDARLPAPGLLLALHLAEDAVRALRHSH